MRLLFSLSHYIAVESNLSISRKGLNTVTRIERPLAADPPVPEPNPLGDEPGDELPQAQAAAQHLANVIQSPAYVVKLNNSYLVQDDLDLACYGGIGAIVASYQPLAQTRQSQAIESRMHICGNCGGIHHIQHCPELHTALLAPEPTWSDAALGHELWRMRWRRYAAFLTLITSVPPAHLLIYAASYQAFVHSVNAQSDLTINDILKVWTRMIGKGGRGPSGAAPAMQVAA